MRCSGCAQPSYCGRACQKRVWSTHKWFCKQDEVGRRTFSFPPLTADEAKHFKPRGNGATPATRSIVEETGVEDWHLAIYRAGWTRPPVLNEKARNTLLAALQKPKEECPVTEPERSYILALLNQLLLAHDQQTRPDLDLEALDGPGAVAFQMCGLDLSEVIRGAYLCNSLGPHFWSRHNDFF